ncbi:hypothetical protein [Candidatus Nitrosopumilus sediminis]|uniref:Uncharacterized protein n=1 Tax=Candidatus Nitrosopumilus sediminis TaxID=1229909 RepID=K0BE11_9ARCH|nr:hypothetical protein [Candidatus Nitrosopumilus sediminis]AFS82576.1 hypothetical protein NSED_03850 [Candidatus Nitrosopumilus sediminis]
MKTRLKFLIPNKKIVVIFVMLTIIMGLATLQGENFSEDEPSILYKMLSWVTAPAWEVWLYLSVPVLYFFGVTPQSSIRWVNFESWEIVYGLNFVYYYFVSVISTGIWTGTSNWIKRK